MKYSILLLFIVLTGCDLHTDEKRTMYVCTHDELDSVQAFVKASIKDANNMSDEEMEDVIEALYGVGVRTNCNARTVRYEADGAGNIIAITTGVYSGEVCTGIRVY